MVLVRKWKVVSKKNSNYKTILTIKSGIEVRHGGSQWVQETIPLKMQTKVISLQYKSSSEAVVSSFIIFQFDFQLKPIYEIDNIRKGSESEKLGLVSWRCNKFD
jgi:hypothetical protein